MTASPTVPETPTAEEVHPYEEQRGVLEQVGLGWIDRGFPLLFIGLGLVAAVGVASAPGDRSGPWGPALVVVAIVPWLLTFVEVRLADVPFGIAVIAPVAVLTVAGEWLGIADLTGGGAQLAFMLIIGIVGQTAAIAPNRPVVIVAGLGLATTVAATIARGFSAEGGSHALDFAPWYVGLLLGIGGGLAFRANVIYMAQLQEAHEALRRQALGEERRRIAREIHDVAAHTMAVTMLHVTAARMAVLRDPSAAVEALEEAERQGRTSMDDIRQIVGLLRSDDGDPTAASLPAGHDLDALIEAAGAAGLEVVLHRSGDPTSLRPAAALTLYRVVQESLTNAARHGDGGRVEIDLSIDDTVSVTVTNQSSDAGPSGSGPVGAGAGIVGMRERVEALGGSLEAGTVGDHWRVRAEFAPQPR